MNEHHYVNIHNVYSIINRIKKCKGRIVEVDESAIVPKKSMDLWNKRGYKPKPVGTCVVKYPHGYQPDKEYIYPFEWEVKKTVHRQNKKLYREEIQINMRNQPSIINNINEDNKNILIWGEPCDEPKHTWNYLRKTKDRQSLPSKLGCDAKRKLTRMG